MVRQEYINIKILKEVIKLRNRLNKFVTKNSSEAEELVRDSYNTLEEVYNKLNKANILSSIS